MYMKKSVLLTLGSSMFLTCYAFKNNQKPNIIFILADDLGYTDVNYFAKYITGVPAENQFYETPNIDRLAKQGVAFTQAYACQLSAPTRASILTGKYACRLGFTTATDSRANTFYARGIPAPKGFHEQDCFWSDSSFNQLALRNAYTRVALPSGQPQDNNQDEITIAEALTNYHSAFLGKWHLGGHGSEGYQPHNQGFEELAYFDAGGSPYYNWRDIWDQKNKFSPGMRQKFLMQGKAGTNLGLNYLTTDLTQRALNFIDNQSNDSIKKPFFLYFCEFAVHSPNQAPDSTIRYFNSKITKGWKNQSNSVYAAMIKHLDISVGKILDKLVEKGIEKNTLIVFMSDNGGITIADGKHEIITNNDPLSGQKATLYEGGIRVPLIISYSGKMRGNLNCNIPVDCNDIYPTILDLANEPMPKVKIDGQSLKGLLQDPENKRKSYTRNTFIWHYPLNVVYLNPEDEQPSTPQSAIRIGDYKLIFDWYGRVRLFNIKNDIAEKKNLSLIMPNKTNELFGILIDFLEKNVDKKYWPISNPNYDLKNEKRPDSYINLINTYRK